MGIAVKTVVTETAGYHRRTAAAHLLTDSGRELVEARAHRDLACSIVPALVVQADLSEDGPQDHSHTGVDSDDHTAVGPAGPLRPLAEIHSPAGP